MRIKQLAIVVATLCVVAAGCASNEASSRADSTSQKVSGSPPSAQEDTPKALPKGPAVEMGESHAQPEQTEAAEQGVEQAANTGAGSAAHGEVITRQQLETFIAKGPSFALTMVRVEPARDDGKFEGFEIVEMKAGADQALAPQMGKGDVITHINGVRIEKPDDYLNAWKLLDEVSQIRIDFLRDGQAKHAIWRVQ